jgi:hypothetical protein
MRLADREDLRRTEAPDTLELDQVGKLGGKRCAHSLKDARPIIEGQRDKCILVQPQLIEFDAAAAKYHLFFEREGNRAVVNHAEGNFDALERVASVN